MEPQLPIPAELWGQIPPVAQAAILGLVQHYEQRLQALQKQVDDLHHRLNQNSTNSSRPPSSDLPHVKRRPPKPPSGRKRGGQQGHARHQRPLVPPEQVELTGVWIAVQKNKTTIQLTARASARFRRGLHSDRHRSRLEPPPPVCHSSRL